MICLPNPNQFRLIKEHSIEKFGPVLYVSRSLLEQPTINEHVCYRARLQYHKMPPEIQTLDTRNFGQWLAKLGFQLQSIEFHS